MKRLNSLAAMALLMASAAASAAPVEYKFDSVSRFEAGRDYPTQYAQNNGRLSVIGLLQNDTTPTTVTFTDQGAGEYAHIVSRCIPFILTMMEKPGKYVLILTIDTSYTFMQLGSCGLEIKS